MNRAQNYRHRFAAYRGDCLLSCFAAAVALHLGIVVVGLTVWQKSQSSEPEPELETASVPVEFIYLEPQKSQPSESTDQYAVVDSVAGGERKPELPTNAGKPGLEDAVAAIVPSQITKPTAATTPATASGTFVQTRTTQTQATQTKAIASPPPSSKPQATATVTPPSAPATVSSSGIPTLQSGDPTVALTPTGEPPIAPPLQSEQTVDQLDQSMEQSTVQADVTLDTDIAPSTQTDPLAQAGFGLDGTANPNRTAPGATGIDATEDPILGEYINQVKASIHQHWRQFNLDVTRRPTVQFTINQAGELVDAVITQPSGSDLADRLALEAGQAAAPFPPLPPEYTEPVFSLNVQFTYQLRGGDR